MLSSKVSNKLKLSTQTRKVTTRRFHTQTDQPIYNPPSRLNLKNSERLTTKPRYLQLNSKNTISNYQPIGQIREQQVQGHKNYNVNSQKLQKQQKGQKLSQKLQKHEVSRPLHLGSNNMLPPRKTTFKLHTYKNPKNIRTEPDEPTIFSVNRQQQQYLVPTATDTKATTIGMHNQSKYQIDGTAGKGTFGVVYEGHVRGTGQRIAIKKVFQDKKYKNRELQIMKMLKHPGILEMKDYFMSLEGDNQYLNVVMDYYSQNLYQAIKRKEINSSLIKLYTYQLLRGLNYLTILSIAHRDIKPQNILVDRFKNKVVICDFGSAKQLVKGQANLSYICSRCYRAPELIFGATNYNSQIDIWSLGCVFVQMINDDPPFLGDSQIDQLLQIVKVLGTPTKQDAIQMNQKYDIRELAKFPNIKASEWKNILKTRDPKLIDLISKMLCYSPTKRLTAFEAMKHPYFDDLKDQAKHKEILTKLKHVPNLFDFTKQEIEWFGQDDNKLLPKWHQKREKEPTQRQIYKQQQHHRQEQTETQLQMQKVKEKDTSNYGLNIEGNSLGQSGNLSSFGHGEYIPTLHHPFKNNQARQSHAESKNPVTIKNIKSANLNINQNGGKLYGGKKTFLGKMG